MKALQSRLSEMLAFMNQSFRFSGNREPKLKKFSRRGCRRIDEKRYPQLRQKTTQHGNLGRASLRQTSSLYFSLKASSRDRNQSEIDLAQFSCS
jgi:hypothetical protein